MLQEWSKFVKSKTARHKLAKFLRDNVRLLPEHLRIPAAKFPEEEAGVTAAAAPESTFWLDVEGDEAPGVLAELARIIAKHGHDVKVRLPLESETKYLRNEGGIAVLFAARQSAKSYLLWPLIDSVSYRRRTVAASIRRPAPFACASK